jgi:hypothetical protein
MKLFMKEPQPSVDNGQMWMGGEAALGPQAEDHVRSREKSVNGLALILLGLAFAGGMAMGSTLCHLFQRKP